MTGITKHSFTNEIDFVPAWAKKVVWYQIAPERFCNGDPSNDPRLADLTGAWPHDVTSEWQIHPWTSDWYALQPYERRNGRDIWFNLQRRRYGGDLQGIIDKIDYLADLGIGAVYLNPVFESPSSHKYDGKTCHHVDANFGPDPDGDRRCLAAEVPDDPRTWVWTRADLLLLELIAALHSRGIKIILDGVFNHLSPTSWPFQDLLKNQQRSRYRDWFKIKSWRDAKTGTGFDYECWNNYRELAELKQDEDGIVSGPKDYIFAAVRRWLDPDGNGNVDRGVDGWRLDAAFFVRHGFWKALRQQVKAINPEALLLGELVLPVEQNVPYLQGDELDAVTNYNFAFACTEYFINERTGITGTQFDRLLAELRQAFPPCVNPAMANLLDCHDTDRLASRIVNRDLASFRDFEHYYHHDAKASNPDYDTRKPSAAEIQVQKLLVLFQMTYIGAPMVYYGDEAGMWGANEPCARKPMVWPELEYADEVVLPDGRSRPTPESVRFNHDLHDYYQKLIAIRNRYPALQLGDYQTECVDDARRLLIFSRSYQGQKIWVALNNSRAIQVLETPVLPAGKWLDVLNENVTMESGTDSPRLEIAPKSGRIWIAETQA